MCFDELTVSFSSLNTILPAGLIAEVTPIAPLLPVTLTIGVSIFFCPCCSQDGSKSYYTFILKIYHRLPSSSMSKYFWPDIFDPLFYFFFTSFFCVSLWFFGA